MRSLSLGLFIAIIVYLFPGIRPAFAEKKKVAVYEYDAHKIIGFTKHLISKDEYYRAYVELQRLHSYYPQYINQDKLYISELYLLYKGKRYSEILEKELNPGNIDSQYIFKLFKADVYLDRSEFTKAADLFGSGIYSGSDMVIDLYLYKRTFLSYLLLRRIDEARRIIDKRKINIERIDFSIFEESVEYSKDCYSSLKEPYYAMCLGIVPGLGYAYSGRKQTGLIALIVISVFSTLTYFSFKTDNKPIGAVFGAATAFFYAGSIIGGYMASRRYNETVKTSLRDHLFNKMELAEDRKEIFKNYGIGNVR